MIPNQIDTYRYTARNDAVNSCMKDIVGIYNNEDKKKIEGAFLNLNSLKVNPLVEDYLQDEEPRSGLIDQLCHFVMSFFSSKEKLAVGACETKFKQFYATIGQAPDDNFIHDMSKLFLAGIQNEYNKEMIKLSNFKK